MRSCLPAGRLGGRAGVRPQPPGSGPGLPAVPGLLAGPGPAGRKRLVLLHRRVWLPLVTPHRGDGRRVGDRGVSGREGGSSNPRVRL